MKKPPNERISNRGKRALAALGVLSVAGLAACGSSRSASTQPEPRCEPRAVKVKTATALRSTVRANRDACVTTGIGNADLRNLGKRAKVVISTDRGSIGHLDIYDTTNLTIRNARFRSAELWYANGTRIEDSVIGGTRSSRVTDTLVNINVSPDVTISGSEFAWTRVGPGTSAYGIRSPGNSLGYNERLHIEGNYIHNLGSDAIQGLGRANDVVIDRNRIDYIAETPNSGEHSDGMQIIDHGANLKITNNWISHEGFYTEGQPTGSSGTMYVHGGSDGPALIENNLFSDSRGRVEICGLGTGGTEISNITIRRNTFSNLGQAYSGFPSFEWDCDSGSGDTITGNVAVDPDGGFAQDGFASAITGRNLWGRPSLVTLDAQGNCTSANCNRAGQGRIGYRKPRGVSW